MNVTARYFLGWLALLWAVAAPAAAAPVDAVAADLHQRLEGEAAAQPVQAGELKLHSVPLVAQFYARREFRPAWLNAAGPLPQAGTLLTAVEQAPGEGLRSADYHYHALSERLQQAHNPTAALTVGQWAELELLLTDAWLTYGLHLLSGRVDPAAFDPYWSSQARSSDLVAELQQALDSDQVGKALSGLAPTQPAYVRLRETLAHYRRIEKQGGWPKIGPGGKLQAGIQDPRVPALRARLLASGDLVAAATMNNAAAGQNKAEAGVKKKTTVWKAPVAAEDARFDAALALAVQSFQKRHGLPADGAVGDATRAALDVPVTERIRQLEVNMERWRWQPADLGERYILVNIPDFRLQVVDNGREVLDSKVIVGQTKRPTPVLSAEMSYLVMNPNWNVPPTIAAEDKLPMLRKNAYALSRQNIRVLNPAGQQIDPGTVNWQKVSATNIPYRFRQDPGPRNALGRIKFMFPNPYSVYLHDTPSRGLFSASRRAFSSGCVRVYKPLELAEYLLKDYPHWSRRAIESASQGSKERTVPLRDKIPVHILYWTAWVDEDGKVNFRDDIYDRDKRLVRALYADAQSGGRA